MSSSVFFKFKSQKEPTRVTFDGTGISVFELKRSIIELNRLGDGTDFDLAIYDEQSNEEFKDDAAVIPRSTSIVARRLPPAKPGRGAAARYVSGKMPTNALNVSRAEKNVSKPAVQSKATEGPSGASVMAKAQSEEEKIEAMFKAGAEQWDKQQMEMANATPVYRNVAGKGKPNPNVPNHPPPSGYVCYRCGEKGHWIQECPTNNDPNFDGRPRVKRTTGIPRSFLRTIEKPAILTNDGLTDTSHQPSGVMVNAEGEFVVAEPDKASWEQYQAKTKVATVAHEVAELNSQELQDRGLLCPIDNKLFIDPTKTPCCKRTYCNDCITNSLIENDLKCPGCQKEGVLIDDLVADEETAAKVKAYLGEKDKEKAAERHREREKSKSPDNLPAKRSTPSSPSSKGQPRRTGSSPKAEAKSDTAPVSNGASKKRPAEDELPNPRAPQAPKIEAAKTPQPDQQAQPPTAPAKNQAPLQQAHPNGQYGLLGQSFNGALRQMSVTGAAMPNFASMPIGMGVMGGIDPNMLAYAGMNGYGGMMNGYPNAGGVGFMQQQQQPPASMYDGTFNDSNMMMLMMNGGFAPYAPNMLMMMNGATPGGMVAETNGNAHGSINGMFPAQSMPVPPYSGRQSQQRRNGGFHDIAPPDNDDDAYFRKPVNPHRHQARQRRARPSDYREL